MKRRIVKTVRTLALSGMLAATCLTGGGCFGTPGYTGEERGRLVGRSMGYEFAQMQDDIDHVLLLRPPSRQTIWNVR